MEETNKPTFQQIRPSVSSYGSIGSTSILSKEIAGSPFRKKNGIGVLSAAIFIVGEMAGSGVLALPRAVVDSGWIGLILVLVFCVNSCYGGTRLAICWEILEERYPEYKGSTRNPYPAIAERAVGQWCRKFVSACIQITLFGAGVVYLLLASQIFQELLKFFLPQVTFCSWFLLFAALITPPMWLGSPKDFLLVGVGAILSTVIACTLIFVQIVTDGIRKTEPAPHIPHNFKDFFLSFGIILFAFGGASTFPTIQNDMNNRKKFTKSVYAAFVVILVLYLPIAVGAYFVYGEHTNANIILSLNGGIVVTLANVFLVIHLVLAFLIVINPVAQEIENIFDVPHEFCFLRCIVRTCMVLLMVMVGETVPQFSKILALVGGSTITLLTFVLPNYFYMKLCSQESPDWVKREIPLHMRIYMWELILIGIFGGLGSTFSAVHAIFNTHSIVKPCYWIFE